MMKARTITTDIRSDFRFALRRRLLRTGPRPLTSPEQEETMDSEDKENAKWKSRLAINLFKVFSLETN